MAEQLKDFAQFNGHEELSLALSKVSDLLHQIKLRSPKLQTTITAFSLVNARSAMNEL